MAPNATVTVTMYFTKDPGIFTVNIDEPWMLAIPI